MTDHTQRRVLVSVTETRRYERVVDLTNDQYDALCVRDTDDDLMDLMAGVPPATTISDSSITDVSLPCPLTPVEDSPVEATMTLLMEGGVIQMMASDKPIRVLVADLDMDEDSLRLADPELGEAVIADALVTDWRPEVTLLGVRSDALAYEAALRHGGELVRQLEDLPVADMEKAIARSNANGALLRWRGAPLLKENLRQRVVDALLEIAVATPKQDGLSWQELWQALESADTVSTAA